MKKLFILLSFTYLSTSYSQEKNIVIDYTVDYVIPKKQNQPADTITIGFDKKGKYVWTNSQFLAKDLAKSVFKGNSKILDEADLNVVLNTENMSILLFFNSGENEMYMNVALSSFIPLPVVNQENEYSVDLISEPRNENIKVLDYKLELFDIFPSNNSDDRITIAIEDNMKVNNNNLFKQFFKIALAAEGSGTNIQSLNLPNGLILSILDNGTTLIEAINISEKVKTIKMNHSFKITE